MPTGGLDATALPAGQGRQTSARAVRLGAVRFGVAAPCSTLVVTFLFAPYFVNGFMADPARGATLWAYATGIAELIAAALAPVLGAIADAGQPRKPWIAVFSAMLVVGLCGLWLAAPGRTDLALIVLIAFGLATLGAELATVFANAMMASLVSGRRLGTRSGFGWAAGYVGGLVSLALVAGFLVADPNTGKTLLGLPPLVALDPATREGDRLVGPFSALWYLVFVLPLFLFTPDHGAKRPRAGAISADSRSSSARCAIRARPCASRAVLLARMIYADGLGAVFAFGGIYAATVFAGARPSSACSASSSRRRHDRRRLRRAARRPQGFEAGDRRYALAVHRRRDRRAVGRRIATSCSSCRSRRSFQGARRSHLSASRSISPSPR